MKRFSQSFHNLLTAVLPAARFKGLAAESYQAWGWSLDQNRPLNQNMKRKETRMKKVCLLTLTLCVGAFAQSDTVVRWRGMEGVITAPGVNNPVGQIQSGGGPWTTRSGNARVNLNTGEGSFEVEGLVFNGGNFSGTPGPVTAVVGTLVCNPGNAAGNPENAVDTPAANLSTEGNAELSFKIIVPTVCNNPVFLIRVPAGKWIATGTKPSSSSKSHY